MAKRLPLNSSGIFYDSADLAGFKKWFDAKILGGATTNPLILQKDGVLDLPKHLAKMVEICGPGFPISIELPDSAMSEQEMVKLALQYHKKFPNNAVIKVPMDPKQPQKAFEVTYQLGQKAVRVNATLGLSMGQLVGAAEALRHSKAKGDNYISLFWARRDEAKDQIVKQLVSSGLKKQQASDQVLSAAETLVMTLKYLETHNLPARIICGSIRRIDQIEAAFSLGTDIVTITPKLLDEWFYTKRGVETVDEFNQAYRALKNKFTLI